MDLAPPGDCEGGLTSEIRIRSQILLKYNGKVDHDIHSSQSTVSHKGLQPLSLDDEK